MHANSIPSEQKPEGSPQNRGVSRFLTMDRKYRRVIEPTNDFFVELDFNAAELRTLIALQGKNQPAEDIHEWNVKNVYRGLVTREEAKKENICLGCIIQIVRIIYLQELMTETRWYKSTSLRAK